ncbi:MAG: hypothetical protein H7X89_16770 [Rhizobiales bacterium]|nr:hypothetical protein [Hyphomicrobiales bacterium]
MSEIVQLRHPDPGAHEPGCMNSGAHLPLADPGDTHVDIFCNCHRFTEPKILSNGSDIAWPAGWEMRQADDWRQRNGLMPPPELEPLQSARR